MFRTRGHREGGGKRKLVVRQNPKELHQFLMWMQERQIKTYLEVGIERGGLLCVVDQFLRAQFTDVETLGTDVVDHIINYDEYHKKYPACSYEKVVKTDPWVPKRQFDLIFIDNNLKKHQMKQQAERLRPFAKYIGFHDVNIYSYGARAFWYGGQAERWGKEAYWHAGGRSPGIGIVKC